jgi:hypothetical protein
MTPPADDHTPARSAATLQVEPEIRRTTLLVVDERRDDAGPSTLEIAGFLAEMCRASRRPARQCLAVPGLTALGPGGPASPAAGTTHAELGWDDWDPAWELAAGTERVIVVIDQQVVHLAATADRVERHSNRAACDLHRLPYIPRASIAIVMLASSPASQSVLAARARLRAYEWWGVLTAGPGRSLHADTTLATRLECTPVTELADARRQQARRHTWNRRQTQP